VRYGERPAKADDARPLSRLRIGTGQTSAFSPTPRVCVARSRRREALSSAITRALAMSATPRKELRSLGLKRPLTVTGGIGPMHDFETG
jgi:hypothetical protein